MKFCPSTFGAERYSAVVDAAHELRERVQSPVSVGPSRDVMRAREGGRRARGSRKRGRAEWAGMNIMNSSQIFYLTVMLAQ